VLVIVSRNIDLSVGSIVGVVSMVYALLMTDILPKILGFDNPFLWVIALLLGLVVGAVLGGFQGFIIAYIGVPSFIVTLGGLLAFRGIVWQLSQGASISGLDPVFQLLGGGPEGSLGSILSWLVGALICLAIIGYLVYARRQRRKFGFGQRPMWAEVLIGLVGCAVVLGLVAYANAYLWPEGLARKWAQDHGVPVPDGGIPAGIPFPIVILMVVTVVMTFIATRRRFGRYVYAYGGNPDAAELADQHPPDDHEDVHRDGRPVRDRGCHLGRPAERLDARRRFGLRAGRDRRGGRRRDILLGRDRDDPGRRPRRARDAGAALRAGLHRPLVAPTEHLRRRGPGDRRRSRHLQPATGKVAGEGSER